MRTIWFAFLLLFAGACAAVAGAPKGSALEDWKTHRATDRADTLIVAAPFDTTWRSALAALAGLAYDFKSAEISPGRFAEAWDEATEYAGHYGAEWLYVDAMLQDGHPALMTSPDCPSCWFTVIHSRMVVDAERIDPARTRVIARMQFVGTPRGKSEPIGLQSTGAAERVLLERIRTRMGQ